LASGIPVAAGCQSDRHVSHSQPLQKPINKAIVNLRKHSPAQASYLAQYPSESADAGDRPCTAEHFQASQSKINRCVCVFCGHFRCCIGRSWCCAPCIPWPASDHQPTRTPRRSTSSHPTAVIRAFVLLVGPSAARLLWLPRAVEGDSSLRCRTNAAPAGSNGIAWRMEMLPGAPS
jgi:hypothetical protein